MKKILALITSVIFILSFGAICLADDLPSWYPSDVSSFEDFHADSAPKVVDDANLFTESEKAELTSKIKELVSEFDTDLVIYTTNSSYGFEHNTLAADFYQFNGYGIGDDYNGSVLMICMQSDDRGWYTAACGSCRSYYDSNNINAIDDGIYPEMSNGNYYQAMLTYIDEIDELYTTGYVGEPSVTANDDGCSISFSIIVSAIAGIIVGVIVVLIMRSSMKKVKIATEAGSYIVNGSTRLHNSRDYYLHTSVSRVKRSDNNHGGSSHSGSFSSSGGRSFSGGGRSF